MDLIRKCLKHLKWFYKSFIGYFEFKKLLDSSYSVFISHNGDSAGGAPVVLLELIRSLDTDKKILLCEKPGAIMDLCAKSYIPSFSIYLNEKKYINLIKKRKVKLLLINTIASKSFNKVYEGSIDFPVFWWIHEENCLIEKYSNNLPHSLSDNIKILCVSERVKEKLLQIRPEFQKNTDIFFYGCNDLYEGKSHINNSFFTISIIGRICERKNQLQLLEAYELLPDEIKNKTKIKIVAASSDEQYAHLLKEKANNNPNIIFTGAVQRKDMPDIYYSSNLIVCSSIDDPLPVVVTEAMMLKTPFVTSSCTGQYSLIKNGINGYTYDINSSAELSERIAEAFYEKELDTITENARSTYLKNFTYETVKNNFERLYNESRK